MICYMNGSVFRQLSLSDPLIRVGLSPRICSSLVNVNIHTVQDLLRCSKKILNNIHGLGSKSLNEVMDFLYHLHAHPDGQPIYPLTAENAELLGIGGVSGVHPDWGKSIPEEIREISLEHLPLSVRAYNCLRREGHHTVGDVVALSRAELLRIHCLGKSTADEIIEEIDHLLLQKLSMKQAALASDSCAAADCLCFFRSIFLHSPVYDMALYRKVLREFVNAQEQERPVDYAKLYENKPFRRAISDKLKEILEPFPFGLNKEVLYGMLPVNCMLPADSFDHILSEMQQAGILRIEDKISLRRMNLYDFIDLIQDERFKDMFTQRLSGVPLKSIANQYNISIERVRQIILNGLKCYNFVLEEDKYIPVFEQYLFTKDEFLLAFGERAETYHYLTIVCKKVKRPPISKFTGDPSLPEEISRGIHNLLLRDPICINGEKLEHNRFALTEYVIRTYFRDGTTFENMAEKYNEVLKSAGLEQDRKLILNKRCFINHLRHSDFLLWSRGERMRYYDIHSRDYEELLKGLKLDRYHDVEYSARKFFLAEPELMTKYDIRNEHELHNLLRKISPLHQIEGITFLRTPNISFGASDRYQQVYDILIEHSPITQHDFLMKYAQVYGLNPKTVNPMYYLGPFRDYCRDGIYDIRGLDRNAIKEGAAAPSSRHDIPLSQASC